jgi:hypothetical protein
MLLSSSLGRPCTLARYHPPRPSLSLSPTRGVCPPGSSPTSSQAQAQGRVGRGAPRLLSASGSHTQVPPRPPIRAAPNPRGFPQAAAASRPLNPSIRALHRRYCRPRLGPPLRRRSAAARRRTTAPGAPRGGENPHRPSFPSPVASPWPHKLAGAPEPPLAVALPSRPILPPPNALDRFPTSPSTSSSKSEPKPSQETRFALSPTKLRHPPPASRRRP